MYLPTSLQFAASWLTTEELIEYWIGFINENELVLDPEDIENVLMSVDLVGSESREDQVDDVLEALEFLSNKESEELLEELTPELRKEKIRRESKQRNIPPDTDMTVEKYQVCFECGRRVGPDAITCSICNIIKFCSEKCNKKNDTREGLHKCLGWAERLKSMARCGTIDEFLKKGSRDSKRRSTKGKEMADLERLLQGSEMALKRDSEKKKSGVSEEEEEGDEKSKLKKKKRKSAAEDGEEQEGVGKKQKKKKRLVDEKDEKKKKKGKKGGKEGLSEDEGGKKGKKRKGKKESEDRGRKKGGRPSSAKSSGSTDEGGGRKSRRKGEKSDEDVHKGKSTRHGRREYSAGGRGAERVDSEKRETARDRKSTGKFGKYGDLDDEDLDRYEDFLLYVSGSAARGMDLNRLLLPYTVLRDGNLYYKLYGEIPLYVENYSHN